MTYSVRIGFILALLSVFLGAGIYHPKDRALLRHSISNHINALYASGIMFVTPTETDLSQSLDNLKFKDYRLVLREFIVKKNAVILNAQPTPFTQVKSSPSVSLQRASAVALVATPSELPTVQSEAIATQVLSAALLGDVGHTQFVLRLSQPALYSVEVSNNLQVITLTVDNINPDLSSLPPLDTQDTAIQNLVFSDSPSNQLIIAMTLLPKVEVQSLRYKDNNLILDVGMSSQRSYIQNKAKNNIQASQENTPQLVIKKLVPSSPEMLARENYNEALDLLKSGNTQGAKELLQTVVVQHANYTQPRILLADILMQQGEAKQAVVILQGVYPQPNIQDEPGYYNLLAEAYRQSGQPKTAVNIYRQLLTLDPRDGAGWVGLGMCFEALDQNAAAIEAYQKAKATQNLSPVLVSFIAEKLEADK